MYNKLYRKNKLPINNTPLRIGYAHIYVSSFQIRNSQATIKKQLQVHAAALYIDIRNKLFLFNINHQI
jgi:hypothetical protein